jgi:hypothetical protein
LLAVALVASLTVLRSAAAQAPLAAAEPLISGGGAMVGGTFAPGVAPGALGGALPLPFAPRGVTLTFDGFHFDDNPVENGGSYFILPDPMGAAGTDRVVAVVNAMIEARTKAGGLLWRDSLAGFFTTLTPANALFDPKVIYDHYEGRFLVIALEQVQPGLANPSPANTSRLLIAVSKTATPASATAADWYYTATSGKFVIGGLDYWSDYPGFEVDEEAVYITNNLFLFTPASGYGGVRLWILHKGVVGGFYAGGAATVTVHNPYAAAGIATTTMPAQVYGAGGVGPGIGTFLVSYSSLTAGGAAAPEFVQVVRVDTPLAAPTFAQQYVSVGDLENVGGGFGFPPLPDAPQSGTATLVEVNDTRALDGVWRSGALWLTTTINPNAGADAGETTAHWFRLDTTVLAAITVADQGNIGGEDIAANTTTFFPSLAVNGAGDAMFGFAASNSLIFPGAYCTGREAGDTAGTVQATATVRAGLDYYIRTSGAGLNRWGGYTGMSLDPTNDAHFWAFNEYALTRGTVFGGEDGRWGTAWGRCVFGPVVTPTPTFGCAATPIAGCFTPGKSLLIIKDKAPDGASARDKLIWKWLKGPALLQSDLGDPVNDGTSYELCVYDSAGLVTSVQLLGGGLCDGSPCWKAISDKGYKFKDPDKLQDGVLKLMLKGSLSAGKSKIILKGKDGNLPIPTLPLDDSVSVTTQLKRVGSPMCWQAVYPGPGITNSFNVGSGGQFKDKIP